MNSFRVIHRTLSVTLAILVLLVVRGSQTHAAPKVGYGMGFPNVTNIHKDLIGALDKKQRRQVRTNTQLLSNVRLPCVGSRPASDGTSLGGPMCFSDGFIDFINHVAHARAIDESDRGFFGRYTTQIAVRGRTGGELEFDALSASEAWDFKTLNRQASHFNQMVGGLIAIDLAHHYLDHYRKHSAALLADSATPMPVNAVITEQEWRAAVLRGARNALACGLGVEGLKAVFECFDRMQTRPAWAAYFIHPKAKAAKINAELDRIERDFFAMDHQLQKFEPGGWGGAWR